MFFDKRLSWEKVTDISVIYFMANCYHFVNSVESSMEPYESEVLNFVQHNAEQIVPIICVERQLKLASRDIAKNALNNFKSAAKSKAFDTARKQLTDATNAILKMATGDKLYALMADSYKTYLIVIKSPINNLNEEEQMLLASAGFAMKNKAINSGLVKP